MPLLNRKTLRNLFKQGSRPTEQHFAGLIDASVNKIDDGFDVDPAHGLGLAPLKGQARIMSIYQNEKDREAAWHFSLNPRPHINGLSLESQEGESQLFFKKNGGLGLGTDQPGYEMEVDGYVGMRGRVGTFAKGEVPADSYWHTIATHLDGLQGFEVKASVCKMKDGKPSRSAILTGITLATYEGPGAHNKIKVSQSGWWWDRMLLRWVGEVHDFHLQIRTILPYGKEPKIHSHEPDRPVLLHYELCQLWSDDITRNERPE
jgi:hypothetical protein